MTSVETGARDRKIWHNAPKFSMGSDFWHEIISEPNTAPITPWTLSQTNISAPSHKKTPLSHMVLG